MAEYSGTVSVEDGVKKAEDYAPPRKVNVLINWVASVEDDLEKVFDRATSLAHSKVHELLHGTAITTTVGNTAPQSDAPKSGTGRVRRTQAQIAADAAAAQSQAQNSGGQSAAEITETDPSAIDAADLEDAAGKADAAADVTALDDMSEFDVTPEPAADEDAKPITDADLNSAVQKKNATLGDPNLIRALIGGYNPDPTKAFQLREISADKRADFLAKLDALTKG